VPRLRALLRLNDPDAVRAGLAEIADTLEGWVKLFVAGGSAPSPERDASSDLSDLEKRIARALG
jgi:hypothetical protein